MIGGFKKLLAGILSFFVGLFAGKKAQADKPNLPPTSAKPKKRSGYFMELDESEDAKFLTEPVAAAKQAVETTKNATVEAANKVVETVKTSEPVAAAKQAVKRTKSPETAVKGNTKTVKTAEPVAAKQSKVELVQTAEGLKAEPAKPSTPVAASTNGQNKTETTFAPKYLNPAASSNSRRRPGANMTNFLDMANQVKNPAKGS